jgi:hypothetical protein
MDEIQWDIKYINIVTIDKEEAANKLEVIRKNFYKKKRNEQRRRRMVLKKKYLKDDSYQYKKKQPKKSNSKIKKKWDEEKEAIEKQNVSQRTYGRILTGANNLWKINKGEGESKFKEQGNNIINFIGQGVVAIDNNRTLTLGSKAFIKNGRHADPIVNESLIRTNPEEFDTLSSTKEALDNQQNNSFIRQHLQKKEPEQSLKRSKVEKQRKNSLPNKRSLGICKTKGKPESKRNSNAIKGNNLEGIEENTSEYGIV